MNVNSPPASTPSFGNTKPPYKNVRQEERFREYEKFNEERNSHYEDFLRNQSSNQNYKNVRHFVSPPSAYPPMPKKTQDVYYRNREDERKTYRNQEVRSKVGS